MQKITAITILIFLLTGCMATELSTQGKPYNPTQEARIRLYGQNGKQSTMEVTIKGVKEKITVGGSFGQALSSMIGTKGNESIGMPETVLSRNPSAHSKILSSIFFKEFVIPAGLPVTVNNGISDLVNQQNYVGGYYKSIVTTAKGCEGDAVTFTPEAGKDYEVVPISPGANCGVTIYEIK